LKRAKLGDGSLSFFKISTAPSTFDKSKQKCNTLEKGMEIVAYLPIVARKFYLLPYWLMDVIGAFPGSFQHPLRIAQRLSKILWAFPSHH
jgi:hypothetical protein